jgi:hypothetical protein
LLINPKIFKSGFLIFNISAIFVPIQPNMKKISQCPKGRLAQKWRRCKIFPGEHTTGQEVGAAGPEPFIISQAPGVLNG